MKKLTLTLMAVAMLGFAGTGAQAGTVAVSKECLDNPLAKGCSLRPTTGSYTGRTTNSTGLTVPPKPVGSQK